MSWTPQKFIVEGGRYLTQVAARKIPAA